MFSCTCLCQFPSKKMSTLNLVWISLLRQNTWKKEIAGFSSSFSFSPLHLDSIALFWAKMIIIRNCPKCKQFRDAKKQLSIWKMPEILLVHFKRFSFTGIWRDKVETFIDFPIRCLLFPLLFVLFILFLVCSCWDGIFSFSNPFLKVATYFQKQYKINSGAKFSKFLPNKERCEYDLYGVSVCFSFFCLSSKDTMRCQLLFYLSF